MPLSILVVDDNEMTLKLVSATLKGDEYEVHTARSGAEALQKVGSVRPALAILDVMMPDMDGYELCRRLRQLPVTAHIPILMLTAFSEIDERMKAFDSGADDFIAKPFQPQELLARVKVHLRRTQTVSAEPAPEIQPKHIAVFSLRGGVGVSTLAVNLAVGLAQLWKLPCLLTDMAFLNGQDAVMLDLPLRHTWADLAKSLPENIDGEVLQQIMLHHQSGLDVLAAPKKAEEAEFVTAEQVTRAFDLAEPQYHYIINDLPHDFSVTTLLALDRADVILLLLAPDLASVRCAASALDVFQTLGYPAEKIHLVLNWIFGGKGVARKEIETALRQPVKVVIPNVPEALVTALTMGKPLALEAETSPAGALFEDLAYFWSKEEHRASPPAAPSPALLRAQERVHKRQQQKN